MRNGFAITHAIFFVLASSRTAGGHHFRKLLRFGNIISGKKTILFGKRNACVDRINGISIIAKCPALRFIVAIPQLMHGKNNICFCECMYGKGMRNNNRSRGNCKNSK